MNQKNIEEYRNHEAWSEGICEQFGKGAAICFALGSDLLLDTLAEALEELSEAPRGTHLGQLDASVLASMLPEQFRTRYDYEFVYALRQNVKQFRQSAKKNQYIAHSVLQELILFLIVDEFRSYVEYTGMDVHTDTDELDGWDDWIFDLFDDMDIVTFLYSDWYVTNENIYHFDHWMKSAFFC